MCWQRTAKAIATTFVRKYHGKFCGVQGQSRVKNRVITRRKIPRRSLATNGDEGEDLKQYFSSGTLKNLKNLNHVGGHSETIFL